MHGNVNFFYLNLIFFKQFFFHFFFLVLINCTSVFSYSVSVHAYIRNVKVNRFLFTVNLFIYLNILFISLGCRICVQMYTLIIFDTSSVLYYTCCSSWLRSIFFSKNNYTCVLNILQKKLVVLVLCSTIRNFNF